MRELIVHEWISRTGGSEKVLDRMVEVFKDAEIVCLWNEDPERYPDRLVRETWIARSPLRGRKALSIPAMLPTWRNISLGDVDRVIVSSHAFSHHIRTSGRLADVPKFVYVHSPARYLWTPEHDGRAGGVALRVAGRPLKALDRRRAAETTEFAANSQFIRERIQRAWDRDARVIYPPVDVERIQAVDDWRDWIAPQEQRIVEALPEDFLLGASRFVPYKRLDLVIAAGEAAGLPVVIAGSGPGAAELEAQAAAASVPVHFVTSPSDELLFVLYQRALALIFPAVEDFGIMPVEAMACGTPVVVNATGGARESVAAPAGGAVVDEFTPAELSRAVDEVLALDRSAVAENARRFGNDRFDSDLVTWVGAGSFSPADGPSDRGTRGN